MDELLNQIEKEWQNDSKLSVKCQDKSNTKVMLNEMGNDESRQQLEKQLWELREQIEDKDDEILELCCTLQELRLQIKEYATRDAKAAGNDENMRKMLAPLPSNREEL